MLSDELFYFVQTAINHNDRMLKNAGGGDSIYLFGAGGYLTQAFGYLKQSGITVSGILDTHMQGEFNGIPILQYKDFLAQNPDPSRCRFIITAPSKSPEIARMLEQDFPDDHIYTLRLAWDSFAVDMEGYRRYLTQNWKELCRFSDSLEDACSRKTLECVLKGRISGNSSWFSQCCVPNQYYPQDIIHFSQDEVIVDLGAYDGDTLKAFITVCPDYQTIYAFEPEQKYYSFLNAISEKQAMLKKGSVHVIMKGAWNQNGILKFRHDSQASGTYSLNIDEYATDFVAVASVDTEVKQPITYMKMDIEGSEFQALQGAARQIAKNRPKLAICVYHKTGDFLDIWNYLRQLVPEYKFYLRHHTNECTETVLYAVI